MKKDNLEHNKYNHKRRWLFLSFLLLIGLSLGVTLPIFLNGSTHQTQGVKNQFIIPGLENNPFKNKVEAEEYLNNIQWKSEDKFEFKDRAHHVFHDNNRAGIEKKWKQKHSIMPIEGEEITKTTDFKDFKQSATGIKYFVFNNKVYLTKEAAINAWLKQNPIKVHGKGKKDGNTYSQAQIAARDATGPFPQDPSTAQVGLNERSGSGTGDKSGNNYTQPQIDHAKGGEFVAPINATPGENKKSTPASFETNLFKIRHPNTRIPNILSVNPYDKTKFNKTPGQILGAPGQKSKYIFVNAFSKIAFSAFKWLDKEDKLKKEINKLPGFDEKKWDNFPFHYNKVQELDGEKVYLREDRYDVRDVLEYDKIAANQEKSTIYATYFTAKDNPALKYDGWYIYFNDSVISDTDKILKGPNGTPASNTDIHDELEKVKYKIPLKVTKNNINQFYRVNLGNAITSANKPFPNKPNIIMVPGTAEFKRRMNADKNLREQDVDLSSELNLYSGDVGAWQEIYKAILELGKQKNLEDVSFFNIRNTLINPNGEITVEEIYKKISKKYKSVFEDDYGGTDWAEFYIDANKINDDEFQDFRFFDGGFNTALKNKATKGTGDESGNTYSQAQIAARDATGPFPQDPSTAQVGLNERSGSGTGDKSGNNYTQPQIDHAKGGEFVAPQGAVEGVNSNDINNTKEDADKSLDIISKHANSIPPTLKDGTPENIANISNSAFHYFRYGEKVYLDKKTADKVREEEMKKNIHQKHIFYFTKKTGQKVKIEANSKDEAILNMLKNIKPK